MGPKEIGNGLTVEDKRILTTASNAVGPMAVFIQKQEGNTRLIIRMKGCPDIVYVGGEGTDKWRKVRERLLERELIRQVELKVELTIDEGLCYSIEGVPIGSAKGFVLTEGGRLLAEQLNLPKGYE